MATGNPARFGSARLSQDHTRPHASLSCGARGKYSANDCNDQMQRCTQAEAAMGARLGATRGARACLIFLEARQT